MPPRAPRACPPGVSVHAAHAWTWYEAAQGQTAKPRSPANPMTDLRLQDGKASGGGLDPQDLYAQNRPRSANADKPNGIPQPMELGQRR